MHLFNTLLISFTGAVVVQGHNLPLKHGYTNISDHSGVSDYEILNFALTLEHLENVFYTTGLQNFSQQDFLSAGFAAPVRGFYEQLSEHEQTHVDNLTSVLGSQAVAACTYDYGVADVKSFVDLSDMLEAIGASAYSGAAKYLHNAYFLLVAASILATEARQSTWIQNTVRKGNPWSTAYETPLDLNQVFTLASGIIVSCPSTNNPLPVSAFPPLTVTSATAGANASSIVPGSTITLNFTLPSSSYYANGEQLYATFLTGLDEIFVPLEGSSTPYTVSIPEELRGFVFLVITDTAEKSDDTATVAGPAMFNFSFDSNNTIVSLSQ